jgi:hypothetical protein
MTECRVFNEAHQSTSACPFDADATVTTKCTNKHTEVTPMCRSHLHNAAIAALSCTPCYETGQRNVATVVVKVVW